MKVRKIKGKLLLFFVILVTMVFGCFLQEQEIKALSQFNSPAETVIGQEGFGECDIAQNQGDLEKGMYAPYGEYLVGEKLIVSDYYNNRILIYNSIPTSNNQRPDVVIGQPNLCSVTRNQGKTAPSERTLYGTRDVFFDGTRLFIADSFNNRVLIYNSIPTENNAPADVVIGQPDFTSNSANQGGSVAANTLYRPTSVYSNGNKLLIADLTNHRVLIYNSIPTSNNAAADVVIGQADMLHNAVNQGGSRNANTMNYPYGVAVENGKLFISEQSNNRVLIFNSIPTSNNASANIVIGQANMTSGSANRGASVADNTLSSPRMVKVKNGKIFIGDNNNNRILIYNSIPSSNGASADVVIGQTDFVHNSVNQGGTINSNTLQSAASVFSDGTKLFISDSGNNRFLIFNTIPTSNNASADVVLGQKDFSSNEPNEGTTTSRSLKNPRSPFIYNNKLFLSDGNNNRILIYNSIPESNNASADLVIGQNDFTSNQSNQGSSVNANTLSLPMGLYAISNKLFVADYGNHRILVYNSIPTSNNASADLEIGQTNMTSNTSNAGGLSSKSLSYPRAVVSDGIGLFVADTNNNRVLIYNSIPNSNNASADVVIGQADFTHNSANQGGSVGANTLSSPTSVFVVNGKLIISDNGNQRILIYNSIPAANNASADIVIGQPNFTSSGINQNGTASSRTLSGANGVWSDGTRLAVLDVENRRTLLFNTIPSSNNASADLVDRKSVV